jgi:hypothetical protein
VLAGVEAGFEIEDELYLCPIFEADVVPLLESNAPVDDSGFFSSAQAVAGKMNSREGWSHPPGSSLQGWVHRYAGSPIVYLLPGDGPKAYSHPDYRKLLGNAVRWVASAEARAWAAGA